jgi:hypothetical protein
MLKTIIAGFVLLIFTGCASHRAIAINEYNPKGEMTKLSGETVTITPEMIKDVQQRRAKFLKEHTIE